MMTGIQLPVYDNLIEGSLSVFQVDPARPLSTRFIGCIDGNGMVAHIKSKSNPCAGSEATHAIHESREGSVLLTFGDLRFPAQAFCRVQDNKFSCAPTKAWPRIVVLDRKPVSSRSSTINHRGLPHGWMMERLPTPNRPVPLTPKPPTSYGVFYQVYWFSR